METSNTNKTILLVVIILFSVGVGYFGATLLQENKTESSDDAGNEQVNVDKEEVGALIPDTKGTSTEVSSSTKSNTKFITDQKDAAGIKESGSGALIP